MNIQVTPAPSDAQKVAHRHATWKKLLVCMLPRLAYPVVCGPLRGARFVLGALAGDGGGARAYFGKVETEKTAALARILKKGHVFFDVGANVGYYTVLGSRLVSASGKVVAIEPAVRNIAYLYRHVRLNKARNVTVVTAACSDKLSLAAFCLAQSSAENFLRDFYSGSETSGQNDWTPVPTVTVDALVEQSGRSPDVLKIDVEGAEFAVLNGARNTIAKSRPSVLLETHSDVLQADCLELLRGYGYTFQRVSVAPDEFLAIPTGRDL
jgi:FkbM family methyltransferase